MTLDELKVYISETLGLEVITTKSLIVCVNNCIDDLHSRGYDIISEKTFYQGEEVEVPEGEEETFEQDPLLITQLDFPIDLQKDQINKTCSGKHRHILYAKVVDTLGNLHEAKRVGVMDPEYKGVVIDGEARYNFANSTDKVIFYTEGNKVRLETYSSEIKLDKIILGLHENALKLTMNDELTTEIPVRDELLTALTHYGIYFYGMRMQLDAELTTEFLKRYKYFVEDTMSSLVKEDSNYKSTEVQIESMFD